MDSAIADELQDWEVLHSNSDAESDPPTSVDEIDGLIQANYFSLDRPNRAEEVGYASAESDNPSWIDPGIEDDPTRFLQESAEFWSDSSSELSSKGGGLEKYGEKEETLGQFCSEIEVGSDVVENSPVAAVDSVNLSEGADNTAAKGNPLGDKIGGEVERRREIVWWKLPMEFLKNCVLRMSPTWTVSFAAAVLGIMIVGRRWYKLKKKVHGIRINVAVDDKKVSQVMSRAARLNEAFSIVKRVPIVRPSLPAIGSNPWPAMSLR